MRAAPACADWPVRLRQVPDGDADPLWGRFARYFGLRTRVLDDFLLRSVREGAPVKSSCSAPGWIRGPSGSTGLPAA